MDEKPITPPPRRRDPDASSSSSERGPVVSEEKARSGEISGRTILVLFVSLLLAGLAMMVLLGWVWSDSPTMQPVPR
jgi:hypothetical protein